MNAAWALRLAPTEHALAARLRPAAGVEACAAGDDWWLRGPAPDRELAERLRLLPGGWRFDVWPDGRLVPAGRRVPTAVLPAGPWTPLAAWLAPEFPAAALPAAASEPGSPGGGLALAPLRLAPDDQERTPNVLVLSAAAWAAYAATAPEVRLARWSFAAAADGRIAVRGTPLPPLPGARFVEQEGVATPAGWRWSPPVEPAVVRAALGTAAGDLALLHADSWEWIEAGAFVAATRSAARRTAEGLAHGVD